ATYLQWQASCVNSAKALSQLGPLCLRQCHFETVVALLVRVHNPGIVVSARPELACGSHERGQHRADAVCVEKCWDGDRHLIKVSTSQLQKVWHAIFCDDAVYRGIDIRPEREKGNRKDAQPIGFVQVVNDGMGSESRRCQHR